MSTYNTQDLKNGKPLAREEGGRGVEVTALYRHPNGQEAIVQYDPLFGNAQANAFERLGFKFVREANPDEIKSLPELVTDQKSTDAAALTALTGSIVEQNKLLTSELNKQREERSNVPQDATDISGERARQSAADQASVRSQAHGEVAVTNSGDMIKSDGLTPKQLAKAVNDDPNAGTVPTAPEHVGFGASEDENSDDDGEEEKAKPLSKQNRSELEASAAAEGVEVTEELDTNKKLREAIEAKQAEGTQDEGSEDEGSDGDEDGDSEESEQE